MARRTLAVAAALFAVWAAPAVGQSIQPGESMMTNDGYCTLNWIYDGTGAKAGKVYVGTAAHCVSGVGQEVWLSTGSLGDPVERIGRVAFVGDADQPGRDYALIEIDAQNYPQVDPSLKGHPQIPTGVSSNYKKGDVMQFSGNGVGFHLTSPTRERRQGILNWTNGVEHQVIGAVTPGDSGGPVGNVTDGNTAFGIVDTVGAGFYGDTVDSVGAGEGGANVDFVLRDAAGHGFTVALRPTNG